MKKLWERSELVFSLLWIGIYLAVMNTALQICGGFDNPESKTLLQLLTPVACIFLLCVICTIWIFRNGLSTHFGLCKFKGNAKAFLWFLPLILMSCINLKNGLSLGAKPISLILMGLHIGAAGYMEEILFRGFLFRGLEKHGLKSAILISSLTFGAGHMVNLLNTQDVFGVILQIFYAVVIGFLYTIILWKGSSLLPCILSHSFVNATSVFARTDGPFTHLVGFIFGNTTENLVQLCSASLIILISGSYALWIRKKA